MFNVRVLAVAPLLQTYELYGLRRPGTLSAEICESVLSQMEATPVVVFVAGPGGTEHRALAMDLDDTIAELKARFMTGERGSSEPTQARAQQAFSKQSGLTRRSFYPIAARVWRPRLL